MSPIAHYLLDSPHQRHSSISGFARDTHIQRTDSLAYPGVIDPRRQLRIEPVALSERTKGLVEERRIGAKLEEERKERKEVE